jgi:polyphosphate kinase
VFPVYDEMVKEEIEELLQIQLRDNVKGRIIDADQTNGYVDDNNPLARAQELTYRKYEGEMSAVGSR